jgi:hypothetical protein
MSLADRAGGLRRQPGVRRRLRRRFVRLGIEALESRRVLAVTWDAGGDGTSWTDALNWSGDQLPLSTDDVVINYASNNFTVSLSSNVAVNSLDCHATLAVKSGSTLSLAQASTINNLSMVSGSLSLAADLHVTGSFVANGTASGVGTLWLDGTANFSNTYTFDAPVVNTGALTFNGDVTCSLTFLAGATLTNAATGTVEMHGHAKLGQPTQEGVGAIINRGIFTYSRTKSGETIGGKVYANFDNQAGGELHVSTAELLLAGGGSNEGLLEATALASTLSIISADVTFTFSDTSDVQAANLNLECDNPLVVSVGGNFKVTKQLVVRTYDVQVHGSADLEWSNFEVNGSGVLDFTGANLTTPLNLTDLDVLNATLITPADVHVYGHFEAWGTVSGAGTVYAETTANFSQTFTFDAPIVNKGSLTFDGDVNCSLTFLPGKTFTNAATGTVEMHGHAKLGQSIDEGAGTIVNQGIFTYSRTKVGESIGGQIFASFQNQSTGELHVTTAELLLKGGGGNAGLMEATATSSHLSIVSGDSVFSFASTSDVQAVNLRVECDNLITIPVDGSLQVTGLLTVRTNDVLVVGDVDLQGCNVTVTDTGILDLNGATFTTPLDILNLTLTDGSLNLSAEGHVTGRFEAWGSVGGAGPLYLDGTSNFSDYFTFDAPLVNTGDLTFDGDLYCYLTFVPGSLFTNAASGSIDMHGHAQLGSSGNAGDGSIVNFGTFIYSRTKPGESIGGEIWADFENDGDLECPVDGLRFNPLLVQFSGQTLLTGGKVTANMQINGGKLAGTGNVAGVVAVQGGALSPGQSAGLINVTGSYTQTAGSTFAEEIGGATPGSGYDRLAVTGSVTLAGDLTVTLINGYTPAVGATFIIVDNDGTSDAVSNKFVNKPQGTEFYSGVNRYRISYVGGNGNDVTLTFLGQAAVIGSFGGAISYVENGAGLPLSSTATVVDADSPDFAGGELRAELTAGGSVDDRLTIRPTANLTVGAGTIQYAGVTIGTFTGGSGTTPLSISLNANATPSKTQELLRNIVFSNVSDDPSTTQRTVRVTLSDGDGTLSTPVTKAIIVSRLNDAPVLDASIHPKFASVAEDATSSAGTQIASLLTGAVTDPDSGALRGIAVTSISSTNGRWEFSLDNTVWTTMGTPSATAALLLPGYSRARFIPKANFNGTESLAYHAWDQTYGTAGQTLPLAGNTGTTKSISIAYTTATLTVTPVNDAPLLDIAPNVTLDAVPEEAQSPPGTLVSALVGGMTDIDAGALKGIAVTAAATTHGVWQYMLSGGVWKTMPAVAESNALLLPADSVARVRFLPGVDFNGTVKLWYRAWDRTLGTPGGTLTTSGNQGGTRSMSTAVENALLTVTPVDDAPILTLSGTIGYVHNQPPVILAPWATISDVDSSDFSGGQLRVRIGAGAHATNVVGIADEFTVDASGNVLLGSVVIGKRTSDGIGTHDLIVVFNANATQAVVRDLVRSITFKTGVVIAGVKPTVIFSVSDGDGATSAEQTKTVNVT